MEVYVARQPIFDKSKKIHAYELLFRNSMENVFPDIDGDTATSKVLSDSFFTIGIENLTGSRKAFINFTQDLLVKRVPMMFPSERIVIELLEDVKANGNVVKTCKELKDKGYEIALDDFNYESKLVPLINLANIIKLDIRSLSRVDVIKNVKKLSKYNVNLLAEKVESYEEFKRAEKIGFTLFQGYFFCKPEIMEGKDIPSPQLNLLEIMAEANREDFEFHKLEKVISRDVAISYKLMQYINSAYFKRVEEISSIGQAIVMLGEMRLRRFISLIAMAKLAADKPEELIKTSIIRAKFCELIGNAVNSQANTSELFTLGLFSLIDAIMDDAMENVMARLPLVEAIKEPLIKGTGQLSNYLKLAIAYEGADWNGVSEAAGALGLDEDLLPHYFTEALGWADSFPL